MEVQEATHCIQVFNWVEYKALASVTSEVLWAKALLKDFNVCIGPTLVFCDNNAAIHLASNPSFHERSKHIEIYCHFTRDRVQDGTLHLVHVKSYHQLADLFTKPVATPLFKNLIYKLGVINIYLYILAS